MTENYFHWLVNHTPTTWWHDSADPQELAAAIANGCTGVTTNPLLSARALTANPAWWKPYLEGVPKDGPAERRADLLMQRVVTYCAQQLEPQYEKTNHLLGYVCAQCNPSRAGDRAAMMEMARFHATWAPNIAVKLPITAAGLWVLEECIAEGISCTATVSFTVPQSLAVAEANKRGAERAKKAGITPGRCFVTTMIGRLDDYLREVAQDTEAPVSESDIQQAVLAVTKRTYELFVERGYDALIIVAALRGNYHMTELCGAKLIMSIHPRNQAQILAADLPREERIARPIPADVIARLQTMPEFVKAYEPDGMAVNQFVSYGVTQRTLSQFIEAGWGVLESFTQY